MSARSFPMQAKSHLSLVVPTGEKRAVVQGRRPNADCRKREHLTEDEIEKLIEAAPKVIATVIVIRP
jgi:hypothetical protein